MTIKPALRALYSTVNCAQWPCYLVAAFLYPLLCFLKATISVNALTKQQHNNPVSKQWMGPEVWKEVNLLMFLSS